jgi:hypothetical protein
MKINDMSFSEAISYVYKLENENFLLKEQLNNKQMKQNTKTNKKNNILEQYTVKFLTHLEMIPHPDDDLDKLKEEIHKLRIDFYTKILAKKVLSTKTEEELKIIIIEANVALNKYK